MKIAFLILGVLSAIAILFLLMNKQKPPARHRKKTPNAGRKSLSDHAKSVSPEQEKPCNPMDLKRVAVHDGLKSIFSCESYEFVNEPLPLLREEVPQDLHNLVKSCFGDMKEFSSVYEISNLLDDPQVDLGRISKTISTDPILSNRILRTANSAFFGSGKTVDSINHALVLLGFVSVKTILFHNALSKKFSTAMSSNPVTQALWGHSVKTALCSVYLSEAFEGLHKGKLYTLGLMHDVGKFILPEVAQRVAADPSAILPYGDKASILREDSMFGINHAVIGRIALEDSGISEQLLKVIEYHHYPLFTRRSYLLSGEEDQQYLTALYLANQIAKLFASEDEKGILAVQPLLPSYQGFVNRSKLEMIFNDERVLADISRSDSLLAP